MMILTPFFYRGEITIPFSKSLLQRAIALACLRKGETEIMGITESDDVLAALSVARAMNVPYVKRDNAILVSNHDEFSDKSIVVNCKEAGLCTRMFSPILTSKYENVLILGEGSLNQRPMNMIVDALSQFGVQILSNQNKLPLQFKGKLRPGSALIDGSESSQLLTGLLIALSFFKEKSLIQVHNLKSKPYIDMTLLMLKEFGFEVNHDNYINFELGGGQSLFDKINYTVEGDWSAASFHAVAAAISGNILLKGLSINSVQADRSIIDVLKSVGANVVPISEHEIFIQKKELRCFDFDATDSPDLFPPLAALAACCQGESRIHGVHRLIHKESNRAHSIKQELKKLGVPVLLKDNSMFIEGTNIKGNQVNSCNDHRIAMMLGILATVSNKEIVLENPEAVNKSYPSFFNDLKHIQNE